MLVGTEVVARLYLAETRTVLGKSCRSSSGRAPSATSTGTRGCATWVSVGVRVAATPPTLGNIGHGMRSWGLKERV